MGLCSDECVADIPLFLSCNYKVQLYYQGLQILMRLPCSFFPARHSDNVDENMKLDCLGKYEEANPNSRLGLTRWFSCRPHCSPTSAE
jgi:hypothetical protein